MSIDPPMLIDGALADIVARASTLPERLNGLVEPIDSLHNDDQIAHRLAAWRKNVARDNDSVFLKRLIWDDLNLGTIRPLLGEVRLRHPDRLPAWAIVLRDLVTAIESGAPTRDPDPEPPPLAFDDLFYPTVAWTLQQLEARVGPAMRHLSDQAREAQATHLLDRIIRLFSRSLDIAFAIFRGEREPLTLVIDLGSPDRPVSGKREIYLAFVQAMRSGGFVAHLQRYAFLARSFAQQVMAWIDAQVEFISRLDADQERIAHTFGLQPGHVTAIRFGLSDPHRGGRSVLGVTFSSGLMLIYKPKDIQLEADYFDLLAWINACGPSTPLKPFRVIPRADYGWVEMVENLPCEDASSVQRFYHRAGMLLCLLHSMNCTDVHIENIIAHGEHPVLIDMETLLKPEIRPADDQIGAMPVSRIQKAFAESVISVGLLPVLEITRAGTNLDISGLGRIDAIGIAQMRWLHPNTDDMALRFEKVTESRVSNAAYTIVDGERRYFDATDYAGDIDRGYAEMYRLLMAHRHALLSADSPILPFSWRKVRFIFRATRIYSALMDKLLFPENMISGVNASLCAELLTRALLLYDHRPLTWPVIAQEQAELLHFDVPMFMTNADSADLTLADGQHLPDVFHAPPFEAFLTHLQALDDRDLRQQRSLIRGVLNSRRAREAQDRPDAESAIDLSQIAPLSADDLIAEAQRIGKLIRESAIVDDRGAGWLSYAHIGRGQYRYVPMDAPLYDGLTGVALFLAALQALTRDPYRDLIDAVLRTYQLWLRDSAARYQLARDGGIGGASGVGAIIYGLTRIATLIGSEAHLDAARSLVSEIGSPHLENDRSLDVIAGSAGAILSLLAYHRATSDQSALDRAVACGDHLLAMRTGTDGLRAWATLQTHGNPRLLTGFSHGAAGIALALLRLFAMTGIAAFRDAASEAIAYEQSVFDKEARNWPDFRSTPHTFAASWCHGGPGIALARIAGLPILESLEIRADIETGLATARFMTTDSVDHLCCGSLGRMDILMSAGIALQRSDLIEDAQRGLAYVVRRGRRNGYMLFPNLPSGVEHFGFFQGLSGIGYTMLRFAHADRLPSVLAWDTSSP